MVKVFVDGEAGTTGLVLAQRLAVRADVQRITLPESLRKDTCARRAAMAQADVVFLCLPDAAAVEAAKLCPPHTILLDASTAHRTAPGWDYGFPELSPDFRRRLSASKRIAVPGCHASGFLALVYPLRAAGVLAAEVLLHCFSLTGYTGGGKAMIAAYENTRDFRAPRQYALTQAHKHLPEMTKIARLSAPPLFCPVVADFDRGMEVTVGLHRAQLQKSLGIADIIGIYRAAYADCPLITVGFADENGFLAADALRGKDTMQITATGDPDRILLIARYDNLGKGACGAALACMNLALGLPETTGLVF
jgi:N-acetyl-gamma-glutamyl-phosphate reductase